MKPPVRFAIASPSRWGRLLLDAARSTRSLEFAGVWSRQEENRNAVVKHYGGRTYVTYDELLADPSVEAVILPTPHFLHHAQTMAALRAGKHVFVEKPIATSLEEAMDMVQCSEAVRRVLAVGHQGRHTGGINAVRGMLARGEFGRVAAVVVVQGFPHAPTHAAGSWRRQPNHVPGGQLDEIGVHYFDVLQYLFGSIRRATGFTAQLEPDLPPASATASLEFADGVIGCYTTYATSVGISRMTIYGSRGALELNRMGQDSCFWQPVSDLETARAGGHPPQPIAFEGPYLTTTALAAELDDFAGAIREGRAPRVGGHEALSALRVSRAILEASATGRTVVINRD